jgi:hypothetical protein
VTAAFGGYSATCVAESRHGRFDRDRVGCTRRLAHWRPDHAGAHLAHPALSGHTRTYANEIAKREALYGAFINEATRVGIDAVEREIGSMAELTKLLALTSRIRLASSDEVLAAADAVIERIAELYLGENKTPREIYEEARRRGNPMPDPLKAFSDACRRELQNW